MVAVHYYWWCYWFDGGGDGGKPVIDASYGISSGEMSEMVALGDGNGNSYANTNLAGYSGTPASATHLLVIDQL